MTETYDLIIVGGGIAGGGLATVMARAGKSVLVLEKTTEYPDLVRGEWLAPWGVVEARRTGLLDEMVNAGGTTSHGMSRSGKASTRRRRLAGR